MGELVHVLLGSGGAEPAGSRPRVAFLREPDGSDEESVLGTGTLAAVSWIDRLLVDVGAPGAVARGTARLLTAPERDRILAALHRALFSARIEASPPCSGCGERFDLDFDLDDFERSQWERCARAGDHQDGIYRTPSGCRFRLPTGEDEIAALGLAPDAAERWLLERCTVQGDPREHATEIAQAMTEVAPVLDEELAASCPECGAPQTVRFDVQTFHLGSVIAGAEALVVDVHRLARAYGWGLIEILALPRSRRRKHLALLDVEPRRPRGGSE